MKRREFIIGSTGLIGMASSSMARAQSAPCPVPELTVGDGSVVTPCTPATLENLAKSLSPGQSSTSLGDTGLDSSTLYTIQWANRFHYDHSNRRAHLLGKNASSQGGQRSNCLYDAVSNSWTAAMWGGSELGHVYESIAYIPTLGEVYTGQWAGGRTLKKWTHNQRLDSWTDPATSAYTSGINSSTQPTICWHPNLFGTGDGGILALHDSSSAASILAWRRSNNQWYPVPNTSHTISGSYASNGAIEYVTNGDFCIAAFSPGQGGKTFRITAGNGGNLGTITQINNVPIKCGYTGAGPNVGILLADPAGASTAYILEKGGSNRVWKYNNGSWSLRSYQHPFPNGSSTSDTNWIVASALPLGVFWCKTNRTTNPSRVWKPND